MNGQQQQHLLQEPVQHQYAVVKKSGSKRDIRENLERENSAIIKVSLFCYLSLCILNVTHCIKVLPRMLQLDIILYQIARNSEKFKLNLSHTPCFLYCHCFAL